MTVTLVIFNCSISNMLVILGLIVLVILLIYFTFRKSIRALVLSRNFAGPLAFPLIGNGYLFFGKKPEEFSEVGEYLINTYGDVFRLWLGPELNIFVSDIKTIEEVLGTTNWLTKASEYDLLDEWLREGLLVSNGEKWFKRRKIITPAFHFKILEQFVNTFDRCSSQLIEILRASIREDGVDMHSYISPCTLDVICGKKWFNRRKVITPAFHFRILDQFVDVFNIQSNQLIKKLSKYTPLDDVDLYTHVTLCALDVICETAMGVSCNAQLNSDSAYVQAVKTLSMILHKRMFDVQYRYDILFRLTHLSRMQKQALKVVHDFTNNVIVARRDQLLRSQQEQKSLVEENADENDNNTGAKKKMAFLDILLQAQVDGKPLSNTDIQEEVDTFMFEGHDTTASAITFCLYNLAKYPEAQMKCFEEICEVIGSDKSIPITYNVLNKLNYLECALKETLRLYPSVPLFGRKIIKECTINGKRVPAGTNLGISPLVLGRLEKLYPQATEFIPERWNSDMIMGMEKMSPYSYIPFSAGPRNCIGQKFAMLEAKSVVSKVLRHFEIEMVENQAEPILIAELILKSKNPLLFKLKPRIYS